MSTVPKPLVEFFWSHVNRNGPVARPGLSECWLWTGTISRGYGIASRGGDTRRAHRLSWQIHYGAIRAGLGVLHRCDEPACVNPTHLFLGTQQENLADMRAKGRGAAPPRNPGGAERRDTVLVGCWFDREARDWLARRAKEDDRSISQILRMIVDAAKDAGWSFGIITTTAAEARKAGGA